MKIDLSQKENFSSDKTSPSQQHILAIKSLYLFADTSNLPHYQ